MADNAAEGTPSTTRRGLTARLRDWLSAGLTPHELALGMSLGVVIGCIPTLGFSTLICAVVAHPLRINQPLIQTVNFAVYPLQLALLLPLWRTGEWMFGMAPVPLLDVAALLERIDLNPWQTLQDFIWVAAAGVAAWAVLAPLVGLLLYASLRPLLQRLAKLPTAQ